jgi:hypothetical protein
LNGREFDSYNQDEKSKTVFFNPRRLGMFRISELPGEIIAKQFPKSEAMFWQNFYTTAKNRVLSFYRNTVNPEGKIGFPSQTFGCFHRIKECCKGQ